jgi:hypothetical protein
MTHVHYRWITGMLLALVPLAPIAANPYVQFDVADSVSAREVSTAEFTAANPGEKLVEVAFQISSLIRQGRETDVNHFLYRIESTQRRAHVVDYLPRTQVTSPIVGPVTVESKKGRGTTLGVSINGKYDSRVSGNASAGKNKTSELRVRYEMLPPKELLAASGTINRACGVYYKLRPSKQTSLEGAREFVCVFRVPSNWRADVMTVHCEAVGLRRHSFGAADTLAICGSADFQVAVHLQGDGEAKNAIAELFAAEAAHRYAAGRHRVQVKNGHYVFPMAGRATIKKYSDPVLPSSLARYLTERRVPVDAKDLKTRLPAAYHKSIRRLTAARQAAHRLNGS